MKIGSDEIFVICLNSDSKNKIAKSIENYLDLFINTSSNHISIRSHLVSQPNNNELIANSEQSINAMDLLPITFGVILPPKLCGKISTISQNNPVTSDENKNSKVCTFKILLDSGASASIVRKDMLCERHKILKDKKNKWSTMAKNFNTSFVTQIILKLPELNHSAENGQIIKLQFNPR